MPGRNVTARFSVEADVAQAKRDLEGITQQVDQLGKTKVDNIRQELEQLTASTGKLAGGYTALTQEQRQAYQQREQDAQSVERLRRSYKTLEGALEAVDVQVQHGHRSAEEAVRIQGLLAQAYGRTSVASQQSAQAIAAGVAATRAAVVAQESAAASTRRLNGVVQQAGWQVSDFANQMANGGNVATAAGMQLGQLLGSLGPLGAALGAVVNVVGVAVGIIQKQAEAAAEAARATDLLTAAQRAGLEITESGADKARRLREERNEQAAASYRAAIAERELADAIAISAALSARAAMEQTQASNARYLAQGPGRFLGPAELSRIEYEKKVYEDTSRTATETARRLNEAQQAYEGFRSGLTKTGGFSGEEIDKLRERVDGIVSSYDDATLRTVTLRQKQEELAEAVKAGIITQTQADDILQKYTKNLDENSKAAKEAAKAASEHEKAEAKLEKQILAAVKAADAKAVEEYNKVMGEGKRVYESTRTPAEKYADSLVDLRRLLAAGAIDQDTFNRAAKAADPAFQEATKTLEKYQQDVTRVATDIGKDISENLWDQMTGQAKAGDALQFFKNWAKRLAVEMLNQNIILPITMQIVGSMPSLFGIQAPTGAAGTAGSATNSLTSSLTNTALSQGGSWAMDKLGIAGGMSGLMNTTLWTGSSGIAPGFVDVIGSEAIANTSAMTGGGATLGGVLSAAGAGAFGGMLGGMAGTAANSKVVGGGVGALAGAGAGYLSTLIGLSSLGGPAGAAIGAVVGLIMGLVGTQKASVGPTASADITINAGGKSASAGNFLVDNDGKIEDAQNLGTAFSAIFTAAALGGGTLAQDFGIGRTAAKGLFVSGSVPYREFGTGEDALGDLLRYTLLEAGGLKNAGPNVTKAIRNTKATTYEDAAKDIALGSSIDAGVTELTALDKSLASFTKSAKETTAEAMKPMLAEFERAKKLGLGAEYVSLATDQLKAYLDQLRNPVDYTQREQEMASLTGQFAAIREAVAQLNPTMATYVDQIEAETRARIKAQTAQEAATMLNEAMGRGYPNQIKALEEARGVNARNLAAVGLDVSTAGDIFNASLTSLLRGLDDASLSVVAQSFTGDIAKLATAIRNTSDAAVSFATDIAGRVQTALGNDRGASLIALDAQQAAALATARASGYDTTQLQRVQAAERAAQAFKLAQADVLAAYDKQITAQQDYIASLTDGAVKLAQSAREFRSAYDALALNDNSPLNAKDRLEEARRQFGTALTTYRDVAATAEERDAAKQTLLSLGPSLVQLAKGFLGSTDTTDYDRVRSVFAELGSTTALGVDTAEQQLKAANDTLKEMQRQRADAAAMGQKQYGALTDLNSIMAQSYTLWQTQLTALQASTGTTSSTSPTTYVDRTVETKRARLQGFTNADIEAAFGGFSDIQEARARDQSFNLAAWFRDFGINEVLSGARRIPGFASGTLSTPPGAVWVGEQGPELLWQGGAAAVASSVDSLRIARAFEAANDRWSGNVTPLRSAGASAISTRGIEQRLDRAVAVLERVVEAIDAGNEEAVPALKTLARQATRSPEPLGRRVVGAR